MNLIENGQAQYGVVILAHGAGMPMDHTYLNTVSEKLAGLGLKVIRFEFPYMNERRLSGKKKFPDKVPVLEQRFIEVVDFVRHNYLKKDEPLYLAGKSLGGRVATLVADRLSIESVFVIGYPFHPIGKPEKLRTEHLQSIATPIYIFQGERDKFGSQHEVNNYALSDGVKVQWFADGDHDIVPRVRSGYSFEQHLHCISQTIQKIVQAG